MNASVAVGGGGGRRHETSAAAAAAAGGLGGIHGTGAGGALTNGIGQMSQTIVFGPRRDQFFFQFRQRRVDLFQFMRHRSLLQRHQPVV